MIIFLEADLPTISPQLKAILARIEGIEGVTSKVYSYDGERHGVTEIHLLGDTGGLEAGDFENMAGVAQVVRVTPSHPGVGRGGAAGFEYMGLGFDQDALHIFAGLRDARSIEVVDDVLEAVAEAGVPTAFVGAFRRRVMEETCSLSDIVASAARHGIRVLAVEIFRVEHLDELEVALGAVDGAVGAMVQIGGGWSQDKDLIEALGARRAYPVLYVSGSGEALEEALEVCEALSRAGCRHIVFGLQGIHSHLGERGRRVMDFGLVSAVKRRTRLPVCVDTSSASWHKGGPDGMLDLHCAAAQGVIAGANMIMVDVQPGGPVGLEGLGVMLEDICLVREAWLSRRALFAP